ncbi:MAG TPA: hypothetical protein VJ653_02600 [Acidimicrobiales bacterium]|nr:hypothetical protein [Acidimicrobiales bacterium]
MLRKRPRLRLVAAVLLAAASVTLIQVAPAQAVVANVKGSAEGSFLYVGLFGGPANVIGPTPKVDLPPAGSAVALTAGQPSHVAQVGPATIFSSGQLNVSTQGTTGAGGTVQSSATVNNINVGGTEKFTAQSMSASCTATESGFTATVTVTNGRVEVDEGDPDNLGDETFVNVPTNPPVGHTIHGFIAAVGDSFDYVFNEQVVNPDGSITVSAGHQKLIGPTAVGDLYTARVTCGVNPGGGRYTPLTPARILDTRSGEGGFNQPVGPGGAIDVQITGRGGVPASGVSAIAMNVTVTQPTGGGYLTVAPAGKPRPFTANLNFTPGQTVPNLVVVKLGAGGKVNVFNSSGNTHVIFDVAGWYSESGTGNAGRYNALVPARLLDTRGGPHLGPGGSMELQVTGQGGVPAAGVQAVVLNVAVTNTTGSSYLSVFPAGVGLPLAANLNWTPGETVSNRVMARLGTGGKVTIYNNAGETDVVVDVGGWYTDATVAGTSGTYNALVPARILDTREGIGGFAGPIPGGTSVDVQITGRGAVPAVGVSAVILNATVTQTAGPGFLTISPTGSPRPLASDLNYAPGETRPNLVVVRVGTGGKVNLFTSVTTHVIFDVAGYMTT